jgi:predicted lipoprotein with Yx(FWY)xxD motif
MRRSNLRYVAVVALAAFALAACSSSSKPSSATTPTTARSVPSTTTGYANTTTKNTTATTSRAVPTVSIRTASLGKVLVDSKGLTLYVWDRDTTAGKSSCTGGCATVWPPVAVTGMHTYGAGLTASTFSVITRTDGTKQLAVNGKPLYTFANDTKPGDVKGQGVNGFHAVRPNGSKY